MKRAVLECINMDRKFWGRGVIDWSSGPKPVGKPVYDRRDNEGNDPMNSLACIAVPKGVAPIVRVSTFWKPDNNAFRLSSLSISNCKLPQLSANSVTLGRQVARRGKASLSHVDASVRKVSHKRSLDTY